MTILSIIIIYLSLFTFFCSKKPLHFQVIFCSSSSSASSTFISQVIFFSSSSSASSTFISQVVSRSHKHDG
ncbi:hypothetical protein Pint_16890 [Pistacia integerrima]|uniref:Uncharacterized protein n=2 Tax=Pistacia TaxID=55512 RepID=A0ACC1C0L2_9ROSI|nr:hypothetical protein Pint_16890 [Pistacia integerrima]KAJ0105685.1 hypothetical protein Patl1_19561 [Pistacia atlantica]